MCIEKIGDLGPFSSKIISLGLEVHGVGVSPAVYIVYTETPGRVEALALYTLWVIGGRNVQAVIAGNTAVIAVFVNRVYNILQLGASGR